MVSPAVVLPSLARKRCVVALGHAELLGAAEERGLRGGLTRFDRMATKPEGAKASPVRAGKGAPRSNDAHMKVKHVGPLRRSVSYTRLEVRRLSGCVVCCKRAAEQPRPSTASFFAPLHDPVVVCVAQSPVSPWFARQAGGLPWCRLHMGWKTNL